MARTERQRAADDALTTAVEEALASYRATNDEDDGETYVLMEYVVVTAATRFDSDGDSLTAVGMVYRDGDVPEHRVLGLLDHAATRIRGYINTD
jgi:hypothetical protein